MKTALRSLAAGLALTLACGVSPALAQTKLKMLLNWSYQGPQGIFFLAADRGYFKEEGLEIQIDQGKGSGAAVLEVARGTYDIGFGDINTVVQIAAPRPQEAPVGVYMMYNQPPFAIASLKKSGILAPADLAGRSVAAPAGSATLKLMQIVMERENVDPSKVSIMNAQANLLEQLMLRGQVDSVAGFVSSIAMAAKNLGIDPDEDLNWLMFSDYGVELYSNAVVVSRQLAEQRPDVVRGLVRAINRAVADTAKDPDAAIDALVKREPLIKRDIERESLVRTMAVEMNHAEGRAQGFGGIEPARMERAIEQVVKVFDLERTPTVDEVFRTEFLPDASERTITFDSL
ncbi:ABC transporter substrate-binding protein [Verticiella sediminum]|uniref:ABC transporter substrate-binding protein n=1 Tax=Verticiella sediminum TaxID=1247510 RepID=A0A556AQ32_9BURK|nr:ABC transporter substrate-binding protein [Verticiella sediminum]TSH94993.1 ABC transporter substrate-binding protein [Verticiella sediminum]